MRVCILGWYGTETLGDRAIIDGIIQIFQRRKNKNYFSIGSIFPNVTERTIYEDMSLYKTHGDVCVEVFDVKIKQKLKEAIIDSDIVIMGGGPLMDTAEMHIIDFAFKFAKGKRKTTAILGCGYGPLSRVDYQKAVINIASNSDIIIMRTRSCADRMINLGCEKNKVHYLCDPAILSVLAYKERAEKVEKTNHWIMNIRDMDYVYSLDSKFFNDISRIVRNIENEVGELWLLPNHTFSIGGDDRLIMNRIVYTNNLKHTYVYQKPNSLQEIYDIVLKSKGCIGMRYHAMVFQSFLNGNSYYLDYTDKKEGKVNAFLSEFLEKKELEGRYINIQENSGKSFQITAEGRKFCYPDNYLEYNLRGYSDLLDSIERK